MTGMEQLLFASTPPYEAIKYFLSDCMSRRWSKAGKRLKLVFIDVRGAHFYSACRRDVFVRLPEEEGVDVTKLCGRLLQSMYGTRDAAGNWEAEYSGTCTDAGLVAGVGCPCIFVHEDRDIKMIVHGDDFISAASRENLKLLKRILEKKV